MKYIAGFNYEVYTEAHGWVPVNVDDFVSDRAVQKYFNSYAPTHLRVKGGQAPRPPKPAELNPRG